MDRWERWLNDRARVMGARFPSQPAREGQAVFA